MIYSTKNNDWQVSVDTKPNGLDVQVSFWDGEDFIVKYDFFVIAESSFEAITDALLASGFGEWDAVQEQAEKWGIFPPNDEE